MSWRPPLAFGPVRRALPAAACALLGAGLCLGAALQSPAPAPPPGAGGAVGFSAFRFIADRNIFDGNRTGRVGTEAPRRTFDVITLVGTMQSASGLFAFFDSTDEAYKKAVHVGDSIAQFTVKRIAPDSVELAAGARTFPLAVGGQLLRPVGGEWDVGPSPTAATASPEASSTPATPATAAPADASDVLKRLMEKRQKQLNP